MEKTHFEINHTLKYSKFPLQEGKKRKKENTESAGCFEATKKIASKTVYLLGQLCRNPL